MATFTGKGELAIYSCYKKLVHPLSVADIPELLGLPHAYHENIIIVKNNKVIPIDESICDEDDVMLFPSMMGG